MNTPVKQNVKLETLKLFQEYEKNPKTRLRNKILELNFGLVRREAHHWVHQCPESYEELISKSTIYKKLQLREQLENEF